MKNNKVSRRQFVKAGAVAAGALVAGRYLPSCTAGQKRYKIKMMGDTVIIPLDDYPVLKEPLGKCIFVVENHPTLIVVNSPDGYVAFGANCPHKKCVVDWHADKNLFICPCHKGKFDIAGEVVGGPPVANLPRYLVAEEGGKLHIAKG